MTDLRWLRAGELRGRCDGGGRKGDAMIFRFSLKLAAKLKIAILSWS
jgi:hypothetical protein